MILCKYLGPEGIDILKKNRIKVSNPELFNDPFEFMPYVGGNLRRATFEIYISDPAHISELYNRYGKSLGSNNLIEFKKTLIDKKEDFFQIDRKIVKSLSGKIPDLRKRLLKNMRVLCLAGNSTPSLCDMLMWSHYTEKHTGFKITFNTNLLNISEKNLQPVKYNKKRIMIDCNDLHLSIIGKKSVAEETLQKSLYAKSKVWKYENEYRWIVGKDEYDSDPEDNIDYIKIENPKCILRIDLGYRIEDAIKNDILKETSKPEFSHIETNIVTTDNTKYKLTYNRITK